jgi:hypothetical protein
MILSWRTRSNGEIGVVIIPSAFAFHPAVLFLSQISLIGNKKIN